MTAPAVRSASSKPPLVLDLDGTLLRTDMLMEGLASAIARRPLQTLEACMLLFQGRAAFKKRIGEITNVDVELLPVRDEVVAYAEAEKASGRSVHLATASDEGVALRVARRFGFFDSIMGSAGGVNLKSAKKARALQERFPGGFVYAGDSNADLAVWRAASGRVIVAASPSVARRCRALGEIEHEIPRSNGLLRPLLKTMRLHQWAKNVLIFVPMMLAGTLLDTRDLLACVAGFFCLGIAASGTYLINDIVDIDADRRHETKKRRPFATGELPLSVGLIAAPILIVTGIIGSFALSYWFCVLLCLYLGLTLSYSAHLKKIVFLDVFVLAVLFTLRVLMGVALAQTDPSEWLLTFSMFFFFSSSLAKRHVEVREAAPGCAINGRGYRGGDQGLTLTFGIAAALGSVMILILYLTEDGFSSAQYGTPAFLWAAPAMISLWVMRIWLLAYRGELDDDPVAFALRDPVSYVLGTIVGFSFLLAYIG